MRLQGTGGQIWPLTSPLENPTITVGGATRFDMNDVPDRAPSGPLAYYVPALLITILGAFTNAGESSTPVEWFDIPRALIKSVEVRDVWHGVPVSSTYWLGQHLRIHEFIGSGFRYGQRAWGTISAGVDSAASDFAVTIRIPLAAGAGALERETSQLALLYQPGSVNIEWAAASVLTGLSSGTTFAGSVRCDLELDPRPELMLGAGVEWVLHRQTADTNGTDIQIKGFGRNSKMTGVLPKGGVLALMELTNINDLGGVFEADDVTRFGFDWRGQKPTRSVRSYLNQMVAQFNRRPDMPIATSGVTSEFSTHPYSYQSNTSSVTSDPLSASLVAWPIVQEGDDVRLTDVQGADSDQTYQLEVDGGFDSGEHLILAQYLRQWSEAKRLDFEAKMLKGGAGSLAAYVLGTGYEGAKCRRREPIDKHTMTADQESFLPWQFI